MGATDAFEVSEIRTTDYVRERLEVDFVRHAADARVVLFYATIAYLIYFNRPERVDIYARTQCRV